MRIEPADLGDPELAAFLQAHLDDLAPTAPAESRHALDLDGLRAPGVRLWVARADDGALVGTGALARLTDPGEHAVELKSMRTDPARRRTGVGAALLTHLLAEAAASGAERAYLETGSMEFFAAARALYSRFGFTECPPFGRYRPDPNSVFMTRPLRLS